MRSRKTYKLGDCTPFNPRTLRKCFHCGSKNYERITTFIVRVKHKDGKISKWMNKDDGGSSWQCLDCGACIDCDGNVVEMDGKIDH